MGFWKVVGRMVAGKPAFTTSDTAAQQQKPTQPTGQPVAGGAGIRNGVRYDASGQKVRPEVEFDHIEAHDNGGNTEVWANLRNSGEFPVMVEQVTINGQNRGVNYQLNGGQERQVCIYQGPRIQNGNATMATLDYRDNDSRDYFRGNYQVEYNQDSDGSWTVSELHRVGPVQDI